MVYIHLCISAGTFDVQRVTVMFTTSSITTTCHFAAGSLALGCSVSISDGGGAEVRVGVAMRTGNPEDGLSRTSSVTELGLDLGVYTVRVYDIESNGQAATSGPPAVEIVVNITETTPEPTPDASPSGMYIHTYIVSCMYMYMYMCCASAPYSQHTCMYMYCMQS